MADPDRRCDNCRTRRARHRYCGRCGPKASALYKRALRAEAKAIDPKYWFEPWRDAHGEEAEVKRREYMQTYMRDYRRGIRRRARA